MSDNVPTPGAQHPEPWRSDLNPNAGAGENYGEVNPHPERDARTAYDCKDVHRRLRGFSDDDLKQIAILPDGARLEQGATYLDLARPERGEFTGMGDEVATPGSRLVLKSAVGYTLWNRLSGAIGAAMR